MKSPKPVEIEFNGDEVVAAVQEIVRMRRDGRAGELRTRKRKAPVPLPSKKISG